MYDFHLHSEYSIDSKTSMEDMVLSAIDKNFKSICFTDHVDFDSTEQKIDICFRESDYFKNIKQMKYKYVRNIEVLAGVEIGMQPHLSDRYNQFITNNPFDFVIMSLHMVDGLNMSDNPFMEDLDPLDILEKYYRDMYLSIKYYDNFDVVGHFDFIDKYFLNSKTIPKFDEYSPLVEKILKLIIDKGKGIELNTSGIRHGLNHFYPKMQILNLYQKLGGDIITIGSGAHSPKNLGYEYRIGEKMLKDLGFKYIYIFKERKKFPINIG